MLTWLQPKKVIFISGKPINLRSLANVKRCLSSSRSGGNQDRNQDRNQDQDVETDDCRTKSLAVDLFVSATTDLAYFPTWRCDTAGTLILRPIFKPILHMLVYLVL